MGLPVGSSLSLPLLGVCSTTLARGLLGWTRPLGTGERGGMCLASGARCRSRGATEMPLSSSLCSALVGVQVPGEKRVGEGAYAVNLAGTGTAASLAAFMVLVFLFGRPLKVSIR